jgi:hypothetical protein
VLAAISAPTGLAIRLAQETNLTLVLAEARKSMFFKVEFVLCHSFSVRAAIADAEMAAGKPASNAICVISAAPARSGRPWLRCDPPSQGQSQL